MINFDKLKDLKESELVDIAKKLLDQKGIKEALLKNEGLRKDMKGTNVVVQAKANDQKFFKCRNLCK